MLVKLLHTTLINVCLTGLPPHVVPIEVVKFVYYNGGQVTMEQFPVTVAYAIMDYKCQQRWLSSRTESNRTEHRTQFFCSRLDLIEPNRTEVLFDSVR